ncbi:MAG TPA: TylF/MycF/NovP-related O-methyltransferase [Marmoricola sp.]
MTMRSLVSRAISKTTGYDLVQRSEPEPAATKAERRRNRKLPADYDDDTREIWRLVSHRTMVDHTKIQFLVEAVRYLERAQIPGAIVECGVWRGGSMLAAAHTLTRLGVTDRDLYLFDTYTGMTPPTESDIRIDENKHASEFLNAKGPGPMAWSRPDRHVATLEDVQAGFAEVDYPAERIHYVVGKVEETVPDRAPETISILRLDTDWYESTKHELDHLYDRLAPGGVLIIDDYGTWKGSKDATDEFLDKTGEPLLLTRVHRSRIAIKPGLTSKV